MSGVVGEVNVNFDSALHLRRYPDATAESLALIPRGIVLLLDGVTESSSWYKVQYQGDVGWVAGDYLILSMNGRQYARAFLDAHLPRFNNQGF
jgi:SH3-like domain-containing protein